MPAGRPAPWQRRADSVLCKSRRDPERPRPRPMPLGPVFDAELVTTARRGRYYALRFAYGVTLLTFVVARHRQLGREVGPRTMPTAARMAYFGSGLFEVLNSVQEAAIL